MVSPEASVQWLRVSRTDSLSSDSRCGLVSTEKRWGTTPYETRAEAKGPGVSCEQKGKEI